MDLNPLKQWIDFIEQIEKNKGNGQNNPDAASGYSPAGQAVFEKPERSMALDSRCIKINTWSFFQGFMIHEGAARYSISITKEYNTARL